MDTQKRKFKLRFNFFDAVIIIAALGAGFLLLRLTGAGGGAAPGTGRSVTVKYTLELHDLPEGTAALIQPGDSLSEVVEKRYIGTVVSVESFPYAPTSKDGFTGDYILAEMPGREIAVITVSLDAVDTGSEINAGGFTPRGGMSLSVTGRGYAGQGNITDMERQEG
ncbi:MAG: DUF4330 domain-containing protein [Oscillospiraceae bacterium]|jgi:hypothetical protein|nr:DUF4330 domain-containing protein [Oscillospiraceae bacterium]